MCVTINTLVETMNETGAAVHLRRRNGGTTKIWVTKESRGAGTKAGGG